MDAIVPCPCPCALRCECWIWGFILAFGVAELEAADELGAVYAFVLEGSELTPENDLGFAFPLAIGVVGLLMPLGAYRGKEGDWA